MSMIIRLKGLTDSVVAIPPFVSSVDTEWIGEYQPISWSVKRQQDNAGSWSFEIPYTARFSRELRDYSTAYFYLDGEELMHGLVDDLQLKASGDKVVYNATGLGEVAALDRVLSQNYSHYLAIPIIVILQEILYWAGWALGDFSTMLSPGISTTIDLREQETVLQQLRRVCEAVPGMHWRWGGYDCMGRPTLDVGFFDEIQDIHLIQSEQVIEPVVSDKIGYIKTGTIKQTYTNLVREVHGNGGTYNLTSDPDKQRVVSLWFVKQLFIASPGLEDPDYPLVTIVDGGNRIRNIALYPAGSSIRKTWDFMVTRNDVPPTVNDIALAALGLYRKCVRYLQEHAYADDIYDVSVVGLKSFPYPGDRVNVDVAFLPFAILGFDGTPKIGESIVGDFRIASFDMKGSGDKLEISTNLVPREFINIVDGDDDVVEIDKNREDHSYNGRASGEICGDYAMVVIQGGGTNYAGPAAAADCDLCAIDDGITVNLTHVNPGGVTQARLIGIEPTPLVPFTYEIVTQPTPTTAGVICFRFTDHAWDLADLVTIDSHIRYYG